ncbi:hypothetical protein J3A83DRAFT_2646412 [Scleroderma citrinum]
MAGERPRMRRSSQVYVEIPPSPLHTVRSTARCPPRSELGNLGTPATSSKRRLDSEDQVSTKKPKQAQARPIDGPLEEKMLPNTGGEYPNCSFCCHQCRQERDATVCVRCTAQGQHGLQCSAKYCKLCLKERYGLILEDIYAKAAPPAKTDHVHGQGYFFTCPKCDGICTCLACRRRRGLATTEDVTSRSILGSATEVIRQDPKPVSSTADRSALQKVVNKGKAQQRAPLSGLDAAPKLSTSAPPLARSNVGGSAKRTVSLSSGVRVQERPKTVPAKKRIPLPTWTELDVPLSLAEAEERILIREFALRFSSIIDISQTHLDELEEIKSSRGNAEDELVPWVSEACAKSLILGLLRLLDVEGEDKKILDSAIKSIKGSGINLNKIWCALSDLRGTPSGVVSFPDPLSPPTPINMIRTRSGANQLPLGNINVIRTAQLVPVISALVDAAISSEGVKQEIDSGFDEAKEGKKEAREAHRWENKRIEEIKANDAKKNMSTLSHHKEIVANINNALKVVLTGYVPRTSHLGRDMDGRTYWALSPGIKETKDARAYLRSNPHVKSKLGPDKIKHPSYVPVGDRSSMKKWSWFIAVWGSPPPASERICLEHSDDEDDEDQEDRWWGFWEQKEITKLANWIRSKSGLDDVPENSISTTSSLLGGPQMDDDSDLSDPNMTIPTRNEVESLVKGLDQYAALLRYRTRGDQ